MNNRMIYCCGCKKTVNARLTDGNEIYGRYGNRPFWKCNKCKNYVGCHYKTKNRTNPLGCIPTPELRNARQEIHKILDPLTKGKSRTRSEVYRELSGILGYDYHTANIKTIEEAREVYLAIKEIV